MRLAKFTPREDKRNDNQEVIWINPRNVVSVEPQWLNGAKAGSIITSVGGDIRRVAEDPDTVVSMLYGAERETQ